MRRRDYIKFYKQVAKHEMNNEAVDECIKLQLAGIKESKGHYRVKLERGLNILYRLHYENTVTGDDGE